MLKDFQAEIKVFLIVALVAIILTVGGILLLKAMQPAPVGQTPSDTSEEQSTTDINPSTKLRDKQSTVDTSGWQTYHNDEFGFEVKYPGDWEVKESLTDWNTKGVRSIAFKDNDAETGFAVQQYSNPKNLSFDKWWDELTLVCNEEGEMCRPTVQRDARDIKVDGFPAKLSGMIYVADEDGHLLVLSGWENNAGMSFDSDTLGDQILSTLRFVDG